MKNYFIGLLILFLTRPALAQQNLPSYFEVLKTFFGSYAVENQYDDYTLFAKKKDGWYVQQVNSVEEDKLLNEHIFWDIKDGAFKDLSEYYNTTEDSIHWESKIPGYLDYDWYNYERIRYFGYTGWQDDMIRDFEGMENPGDTLLDGMGRAYSNNMGNQLWSGKSGMGMPDNNLQEPLKRMQSPSAERIEWLTKRIDHALRYFEKLNTQNPNYQTIVGNANLKLFNETMHGYCMLMMCGAFEKAAKYLDQVNLDERYINEARNYLNSCKKNAILFTYGDNDTYQLWFVQEKMGYRKDVAVINNSLLGISMYAKMLKERKLVSFNTPDSYLADEASNAAYLKKGPVNKNNSINLHAFIRDIYVKKYPMNDAIYTIGGFIPAGYLSQNIFIQTPSPVNKKIKLSVQEAIYLNDYMMLDIMDANINKRPICFTSLYNNFFRDQMTQTGIVYSLDLDKDPKQITDDLVIKNLEKYILEKHVPVLSNYQSNPSFISFDGDNTLLALYLPVIRHYQLKKDTATAVKWLHRLLVLAGNFSPEQVPTYKNLEALYLSLSNNEQAKKIMEMNAQWTYDAYKHPSSLKGFYSKASCTDLLTGYTDWLAKNYLESPVIYGLLEKINHE